MPDPREEAVREAEIREILSNFRASIEAELRERLLGKPEDGAQLKIREAAGDAILGCEWCDSEGEPLAPNDPQLEGVLDEIALVAEAICRKRWEGELLSDEAVKAAEIEFLDPLNIGVSKSERWRRVLLAAWEVAIQKQEEVSDDA